MSSDANLRAIVKHLMEIAQGPETEREDALRELRDLYPSYSEQIEECLLAVGAGAGFAELLAALQSEDAASTIADSGSAPASGARTIGPYRILRTLGQGGMGIVYLAVEKGTVRRRVALKVIKRGMDTEQVIARFGLERQALAVMSHPSIAKVFHAGSTESGQPYLAMEFVEGVSLTDYCDTNRLTLEERIGVFQQVCRGVQHAHQKGVLHRDLKPGNILVARKEDQHVVKIIDFGLARATDQQLVEQTIYTEQGKVIGTPEYMSPEQAGGSALAIDTRTDIYSLGVILYELITGELPFSSAELRDAGDLELQRIIREVEPLRPSSRLSAAGEATDLASHHRRLSPAALRKRLRGELDWIVMRAMSKEPHRRYDSATSLARDLDRYLANEPVEAGPPSAGYRVRKFTQRYRTQVVAGSLVLVTAVIGSIVAWIYANEAWAQATRFDRLSVYVRLQDAVTEQDNINPPWPENAPRLRRWLAAVVPGIERDHRRVLEFRDSLTAAATPRTAAERESDRRSHPRFYELAELREHLAELRANREPRIEGAITATREQLARLEELVDTQRPWQFRSRSEQLLFAFMNEVDSALEVFSSTTKSDVERRLWWAERIGEATLSHPLAVWSWDEVAVAIRQDPKYQFRDDGGANGSPSEPEVLSIGPQWGLVPMGRNPVTGLFEFYHLRSAWDPKSEVKVHPNDLPIPRHKKDGTIDVQAGTGMVFVLLPKARTFVGAQRDPTQPYFYEMGKDRQKGEQLRRVTIEAFFLARHETTQGQWIRLFGQNPSWRRTGDLRRPVQQVSWDQGRNVFRSFGLDLPWESEWEYACRAHSQTPWFGSARPDAKLRGHANLLYAKVDASGRPVDRTLQPDFSPVGRFTPNDFGMHDMHGNVFEWCRDFWENVNRMYRGGGYDSTPPFARSSICFSARPNVEMIKTGLRAARAIR